MGAPLLLAAAATCRFLFVHGVDGNPAQFAPMAEALRPVSSQQAFVSFDPPKLGMRGLSQIIVREVTQMARCRPGGPCGPKVIVAHSMGGLLAREALNSMHRSCEGWRREGRALPAWCGEPVRLIAIDTPWHGFDGPADSHATRWLFDFLSHFVPRATLDLRAESDFFRGLYKTILPLRYAINGIFAEGADPALDYTDGALRAMGGELAAFYRRRGDVYAPSNPKIRNFYQFLVQSEHYFAVDDRLRALAAAGTLDARAVRTVLQGFYPRLRGDHAGVLASPDAARAVANLCRAASVSLRNP